MKPRATVVAVVVVAVLAAIAIIIGIVAAMSPCGIGQQLFSAHNGDAFCVRTPPTTLYPVLVAARTNTSEGDLQVNIDACVVEPLCSGVAIQQNGMAVRTQNFPTELEHTGSGFGTSQLHQVSKWYSRLAYDPVQAAIPNVLPTMLVCDNANMQYVNTARDTVFCGPTTPPENVPLYVLTPRAGDVIRSALQRNIDTCSNNPLCVGVSCVRAQYDIGVSECIAVQLENNRSPPLSNVEHDMWYQRTTPQTSTSSPITFSMAFRRTP